MLPRGTLMGPASALRVLEGGAGRLLSVRELAARLGVSTATIYGLCHRGELAHVRISNAYRVHPDDLDRFIDRKRRRGEV